MMKKTFLLFLSLLVAFASCKREKNVIPKELVLADSLMNVRPDSAMCYLASLDSFIQGKPEYIRMYYSLQKIKAQDKCYIPHTTDSVILSIVDFYTRYGNPDLLMEALYYLGSVYSDMGDSPLAIETFQRAADLGKENTAPATIF